MILPRLVLSHRVACCLDLALGAHLLLSCIVLSCLGLSCIVVSCLALSYAVLY